MVQKFNDYVEKLDILETIDNSISARTLSSIFENDGDLDVKLHELVEAEILNFDGYKYTPTKLGLIVRSLCNSIVEILE